jgi:hypothetical protein
MPTLSMMDTDLEVFRKRGESAVMTEEYERTRAAFSLGESSGLFAVPRIIQYDTAAAFVESERIADLITIRQLAAAGDARLYGCLEQAGVAMAFVHAHLRQERKVAVEFPTIPHFPGFLEKPGDAVFLHGDLTGDNVGLSPSRQRLFIVDWSTAPMLGRRGNFGSRYFDLVWFTGFLFQPMSVKQFWRCKSEDMASTFLRAYAAHFPGFDPRAYGTFGLCLFPCMAAWWKHCEWEANESRPPWYRIALAWSRFIMARRWHSFLSRRSGVCFRQAMIEWGLPKDVLRKRRGVGSLARHAS